MGATPWWQPWLPLIGVLVGALTSILGGMIAEFYKERLQMRANYQGRRVEEAARFREATGRMLTLSATRRSQIAALNHKTSDVSGISYAIDVMTQKKSSLSEEALAVLRSGAEIEAAYYQISLSEIDAQKQIVDLWNSHKVNVSSLGMIEYDVRAIQEAEQALADAVRTKVPEYLAAKK